MPLFLRGNQCASSNEEKVLSQLWKSFGEQYSPELLEEFRQLATNDRVLIIDDWHKTSLNAEGRRHFLELVRRYFDKIFLFVDELFQIHELIDKSTESILEFDHATIMAFGHVLRGSLIDKWVTLGREYTGDSKQITREIEQKERLIDNLMGKNTLPRLPFIILSLLEADEADKAEGAEAGSFGYLYEVLVTVALNQSKGPKAQLEKKYNFLARLAYRMFKSNTVELSLSKVREIAEEYSKSHLISVDIDSMLNDLTESRVLTEVEGNYSFAYWHLFYYFVARYYRDNMDREKGLREEIEQIADYVSFDHYAAILMFVVYFARDSSDIVRRLVSNADKIYSAEQPATLEDDVAFLNNLCRPLNLEVPEEVDVAKNREERRELHDRIERGNNSLPHKNKQAISYSESLSDSDKFDLAYRYIGLLGQVIRNFPGSLPGAEKLLILKSTYLLGLRLLHALLRIMDATLSELAQQVTALMTEEGKLSTDKIRELVDRLIISVSRVCALSVITQVSGSVGVADLETAYKQALDLVGETNASQLIGFAIKLDHAPEFPVSETRELHKLISNNPFADDVLAHLVVGRLSVVDVDRRIRQSMASLFNLPANMPMLIEANVRKT